MSTVVRSKLLDAVARKDVLRTEHNTRVAAAIADLTRRIRAIVSDDIREEHRLRMAELGGWIVDHHGPDAPLVRVAVAYLGIDHLMIANALRAFERSVASSDTSGR